MVNEAMTIRETAPTATEEAAQKQQQQIHNFNRPFRWFKLVCGVASAAGFGYGLRTAWAQARPLRPGELPKATILPAAGMAMQAFGLATIITVSGYFSILVLISEAMGVNTFKEFGQKATTKFGDRYRIPKGEGESYDSLSALFEAAAQAKSSNQEKDDRTSE